MTLPAPNYDESLAGPISLPDALTNQDGSRVAKAEDWIKHRRTEVLDLFENEVYGHCLQPVVRTEVIELNCQRSVLDGLATRKQIRIQLSADDSAYSTNLDLLLYLPDHSDKPTPLFLGYNFSGNHTVHPDRGIELNRNWVRNSRELGITDNVAREENRGALRRRWPVERILSRGYGLATIYYGDVDPDFDDGYQNGVHPLFHHPDQVYPGPQDPGSIGAWAWGLSRILDHLETEEHVDGDRVCVMGHSRLGKTALWAGATDTRFAMAISNESGCGGAALSRRHFGETVEAINTRFPHWFCDNFRKYNAREDTLPVDQHMLIALIAPRPVYIASAADDLWSDPRGEYLGALHASPVYELLGTDGLVESWEQDDPAREDRPVIGTPRISRIRHHLRPGGHDVTDYDWERFLDFADIHLT